MLKPVMDRVHRQRISVAVSEALNNREVLFAVETGFEERRIIVWRRSGNQKRHIVASGYGRSMDEFLPDVRAEFESQLTVRAGDLRGPFRQRRPGAAAEAG